MLILLCILFLHESAAETFPLGPSFNYPGGNYWKYRQVEIHAFVKTIPRIIDFSFSRTPYRREYHESVNDDVNYVYRINLDEDPFNFVHHPGTVSTKYAFQFSEMNHVPIEVDPECDCFELIIKLRRTEWIYKASINIGQYKYGADVVATDFKYIKDAKYFHLDFDALAFFRIDFANYTTLVDVEVKGLNAPRMNYEQAHSLMRRHNLLELYPLEVPKPIASFDSPFVADGTRIIGCFFDVTPLPGETKVTLSWGDFPFKSTEKDQQLQLEIGVLEIFFNAKHVRDGNQYSSCYEQFYDIELTSFCLDLEYNAQDPNVPNEIYIFFKAEGVEEVECSVIRNFPSSTPFGSSFLLFADAATEYAGYYTDPSKPVDNWIPFESHAGDISDDHLSRLDEFFNDRIIE